MTITQTWWKNATVYQIWPASFKDSNGDGFGDIPGIISKLDHIKNLGVDVIWLSPHYDSPQEDMGYDISDYESVYHKYGTLEDMDNLIAEVHSRNMKLICDLVINHTSVEHQWFKESRSSKTNPKRDWYVWKPPRYDEQGNRQPPNNWMSIFAGSAWKYDELTDEYFLHLFAEGQPDLNWENEETRQAIYKSALTFWYEKGIDGFRIDTACLYSKHQSFEDAPMVIPDSEWQPAQLYFENGPRIHEFHKEMFEQVTSKYDAMTVGEVAHATKEEMLQYVSEKEREMNMIFTFQLVDLGYKVEDRFDYQGFDLKDFKKAIETQAGLLKGTDGWSTAFIENHDQPRSITRFGNDSPKHHIKSGKLLALLMSSLSGTLFIYQGQEIGMTNVPRSWSIEDYLDVNSINFYKSFVEKHGDDPEKLHKFMDAINLVARDHARTPVQWDSSEHAGFSTAKPWMKVHDNYKTINAASQVNDPDSLYSFWKTCLSLRKEFSDLLVYGNIEILDYDNLDVFTYVKESNGVKAYYVLNFSEKNVPFQNFTGCGLEFIHSNVNGFEEDNLSPYEGRFYLVK